MTEQETVECKICHEVIDLDEAHEVLESTFICDPAIEPRCLGEWNNQPNQFIFRHGAKRSEFYD